MTVEILTEDRKLVWKLEVTPESMKLVRLGFNPSGLNDVAVAKILAAASISHIRGATKDGREGAVAATHFETAAMWAVKGITADL